MIAPALADEFGLDPSDLGFVTGAFFAAFALSQLPLGLALDRFGPRAVVTTLHCAILVGGLVHMTESGISGLAFGRFLIGIGMAASLMGGIKAASLWFPPERLAPITALHVALTGVGGMLATGPMATVLALAGWRGVMAGSLFICLVLIILLQLWVPRLDGARAIPPLGRQLTEFRAILTSFHYWRIAPVDFAGAGVGIGYQTLWAGLWLRDVAGYGEGARAWVLFAMFAGVLVGNLGFGWWVRRRLARGGGIVGATISGFACMIVAQIALIPLGGGAMPTVLWVAVSVLFAFPIAGFAIVAGGFTADRAGRAASAVNGLLFVAVCLTQWASGLIIEAFPIAIAGGYAPLGHRVGLATATATAVQIITLVWWLAAPQLRS